MSELLHKKGIDKALRSQFVGTLLLHIKDVVGQMGVNSIDEGVQRQIKEKFRGMTEGQIRAGICDTLEKLLDASDNKQKKIDLLQKNVLNSQRVKDLKNDEWVEIIDCVLMDIYKYIDTDSSEGQDILNLFFIAFNKYAIVDRNMSFTPDHITEFMCCITEVDSTKRVLDATCGSGSFLVQAMVKELEHCGRGRTAQQAKEARLKVKESNIYGIEMNAEIYGLAVTNMLIHGDGNSNVVQGNCFDMKKFIKESDPDVVLMNPPYNAIPKDIPKSYKMGWGKANDDKGEPTKGLVFVSYISDVIKEINEERCRDGQPPKTVKLAVLLPFACAIGRTGPIKKEKSKLLEDNTLEAVFSLPSDLFASSASVCTCCMLFTLGQPHVKLGGITRSTFFGYCKDDGFVRRKNIGRVEQYDGSGNSKWKAAEAKWLDLFERKAVVDGFSAVEKVTADDEWLCEAYMKTDYSKLTVDDFQRTLNNYLACLLKEGHIYKRREEDHD